MSKVKRFARNTTGRDFVAGDIHGCFGSLDDVLLEINFDPSNDRLFSVGDLVDRGPLSEESIEWIAKPWFHAVRGNHEQMAIGVAAGKHDLSNYLANGGGWFLSMEESQQRAFAEAFDALPYAIEIDHEIGRIGIVHAEIPGESWVEFCEALEMDQSNNKFRNLKEIVLWSRSRIQAAQSGYPTTIIGDLNRLYVGHTPLREPFITGNVHYIDTGCVFGGRLTVEEIA